MPPRSLSQNWHRYIKKFVDKIAHPAAMKFLHPSGGGTFGCVPKLAFKISIPIGDLERPDKLLKSLKHWQVERPSKFRMHLTLAKFPDTASCGISQSRIKGNFTEQNRMPNAILRQAKAPPKSKRLHDSKNFHLELLHKVCYFRTYYELPRIRAQVPAASL